MKYFLCAIAVILAGCDRGTDVRAAKAAAAYQLIDPDSAKFRDVSSTKEGVVCGQINGKNRMGAYSGFTPFYSRPIDGQWDAKIVQVNNDEQLDAVWKALCSPKPLPGANLGASKAEADVATEVAVAPTPVPDSGKCRGAWRTRSEEETSLLLTVTADEVIYEGSDEPIFVSKPSAEANGDILFNYSDPAYKLRLRCHVTGATLQSERGAEKGEVTKLVRA